MNLDFLMSQVLDYFLNFRIKIAAQVFSAVSNYQSNEPILNEGGKAQENKFGAQ